jgi:hypothetical protein
MDDDSGMMQRANKSPQTTTRTTKLTRSQSLSNCLAKKNMQSRMRAASDLIEQHKISHLNLKRLKEQQNLKNSMRKSSAAFFLYSLPS